MKNLSENVALELMRENRPLMRMHTTDGLRWYVVPGGWITDAIAQQILRRSDVQPQRDGLFPNCDQTFRLKNNWRRP
jgi:hypothetical protein